MTKRDIKKIIEELKVDEDEEEAEEAEDGEKKYPRHFVDLVFQHKDLYILGFIYKRVYYRLQESKADRGKELHTLPAGALEEIPLPFGGSYQSLGVSFGSDIPVGIPALEQMFETLINVKVLRETGQLNLIKDAIVTAVVIFSESLRFPKLQRFIACSLNNPSRINIGIPKDQAQRHFHKWDDYSAQILNGNFKREGIFQDLADLLDFVGILLRSAERNGK